MIVECPSCNARYRVDEGVLEQQPKFRCSRCSYIFSHSSDDPDEDNGEELTTDSSDSVTDPVIDEEEETADPTLPDSKDTDTAITPSTSAGESLSFSFETNDHSENNPDENEPGGMEPSEEETEENVVEEAESNPETEFNFAGDEDNEPAESEPDDEAQPRFVRGEDELRITPPSGSSSFRPWLIFTAVLILVWVNVALYLRGHPTETVDALAKLPLVGHALTVERVLRTRVHLDELRGSYQRIKGDLLVFIVAGRAINTSMETLRGVQIESALYGPSGDPVQSKSIYCGNAMSLKIVKDLSSKEISLLQRLEPPQRFEIRPGQSAAFTVVFMDPPEEFREFSTQVVAAERTLS